MCVCVCVSTHVWQGDMFPIFQIKKLRLSKADPLAQVTQPVSRIPANWLASDPAIEELMGPWRLT